MRKLEDGCEIYFILDGKDWAFKRWFFVPRTGDEIMFHTEAGPVQFTVTKVVWNVGVGREFVANVHMTAEEQSDD